MLKRLKKITTLLGRLHAREDGQTLAEDALILSFVVAVSITTLTVLSLAVSGLLTLG